MYLWVNFCQNASTLILFPDLKNDVIWISTLVMETRDILVQFHNIILWISSILEIPIRIFFVMNWCNVQFMRIISLVPTSSVQSFFLISVIFLSKIVWKTVNTTHLFFLWQHVFPKARNSNDIQYVRGKLGHTWT